MTAFRLLLAGLFVMLTVYTLMVGSVHGYDLIPVFFAAIADIGWPGQFNLDFACFLLLLALWVAWRHDFSATGLVLAPVASLAGTLFLASYVLILTVQAGGDMAVVLLGRRRAARYRIG